MYLSPEQSLCPASDSGGGLGGRQGLALTSWSMVEVVMRGLWYFDEIGSAKSMGDDLVHLKSSYSLLLRWGEMASPAEVEAEPPEPSELTKELLS